MKEGNRDTRWWGSLPAEHEQWAVKQRGRETLALKHHNLHCASAVLVVHAHELEGAGAPLVLGGVDSLPQVQQHALAGVVNVLDDVAVAAEELASGSVPEAASFKTRKRLMCLWVAYSFRPNAPFLEQSTRNTFLVPEPSSQFFSAAV